METENNLKICCIIPARGGSKGIPQKNIHLFLGKPLIAYSIEQALQSSFINRVVVSTDEEKIASISKGLGAEIVWRPKEICGDLASSESALLHCLNHLKKKDGYEPDLVVFLQVTSPVRYSEDIDEAIQILYKNDADSVFSACLQPFIGRWKQDKDGLTIPINYNPSKRPRRQDYPIEYIENGSLYVFKPWVICKTGNRVGGKITAYEMPVIRSFQIDTLEDIPLLEFAHKFSSKSKIRDSLFELSVVKLLILDFDGVLTDNNVYVDQNGKEAVVCNRSDSYGIEKLIKSGISIFVLSKERNPVVAARCQKLGLQYIQGCNDKLKELKKIAMKNSINQQEVVYVGNDLNDIDCMRWAGIPIAVADAADDVKDVAKYITKNLGGRGAVREVADMILMKIK